MIEFEGVTKQYLYGKRILGAAELTVKDGEIVALLGGEGSGKTTLLKVGAGVTDCEGSVSIDGSPIAKRPDDVMMIFDDLAVFDRRSSRYNLSYPLKIRGFDKVEIDKRIAFAADRLGITACLDERVKKLPLIDVKRLAVARMLIRDVRVILIDDITNGLTRSDAEQLWSEVVPILRQKASEGVSIIFATESVEEAMSIADRIVTMHYGDIKQIGTAEEIYNNPSSIWAAQALDRHYAFERARLTADSGLMLTFTGGYTLDASCFAGRVLEQYIGGDVLVGWHSDGYAENGERTEKTVYTVKSNGKTLHFVESGRCVALNESRTEVCTLPDISKAQLYDVTNESSILYSK